MLISAAATNIGLRRENNEDSFFCGDKLFAVADGLGGHAAGEIASQLAINILRHRSEVSATMSGLGRTFEFIHDYLILDTQTNYKRRGMGTTLTALRFDAMQNLIIAHVGDSVCYRLRDDHVEKLTKEHSIHGRLVNCLGGSIDAFSGADLDLRSTKPFDVYVICSDGLSNYLKDDPQELTRLMRIAGDPSKLPKVCIDYALSNGGSDNVTVVAVGVAE